MKNKLVVVLCLSVLMLSGCGAITDLQKASLGLNLYTIDATIDVQKHTITAHQNVKYKNDTGVKLNNICFHLYPNAFSQNATTTKAVSANQFEKCYYNGFSEGNININSVNYNNTECNYEVAGADNDILVLNLPTPLDNNLSGVIDIDFVVLLPNANHRFGYGKNTINCGNFYPVLCIFEDGEWNMQGYHSNGDPFYSEMANYNVNITYPKGYTLVTTGEQNISNCAQNQILCTCKVACVRDFSFILSNKYEVVSAMIDDVKVNYYYYDDVNAQNHLKTACDALNTFNNLIGKYPYNVLNVCKANFLQGGMEYPNLVFISDAVDVDSEYNNVIIHEIAHQWFYGIVGNNEAQYPWLDESLTEYVTALFYDKNLGYTITTKQVLANALSSYLLFCDMYKEVYGNIDTSMNRSIYNYKTETEYVYMTYVKGVLMFDSVCELVGKNKMGKCIAQYYKDNAFKIATPKNLIQSFERASGKKLTNFITSWLDGSVVLEELSR